MAKDLITGMVSWDVPLYTSPFNEGSPRNDLRNLIEKWAHHYGLSYVKARRDIILTLNEWNKGVIQ